MKTAFLTSVGLLLAMASSAWADTSISTLASGKEAPAGPLAVLQCADCPPGGQLEGEPECNPQYVDVTNGGCSVQSGVGTSLFTMVDCATICGESGTWTNGALNFRDTDWYQITVGAGTFTYTGIADGFDLRLIVNRDDGAPPCPAVQVATVDVGACEQGELQFTGPGTFYLFASPVVFTGVPCGSSYRLHISGAGVEECLVTDTQRSSWGAMKTFYR